METGLWRYYWDYAQDTPMLSLSSKYTNHASKSAIIVRQTTFRTIISIPFSLYSKRRNSRFSDKITPCHERSHSYGKSKKHFLFERLLLPWYWGKDLGKYISQYWTCSNRFHDLTAWNRLHRSEISCDPLKEALQTNFKACLEPRQRSPNIFTLQQWY